MAVGLVTVAPVTNKRRKLTTEELAAQVRTHLVYELKWLISAADEFQRSSDATYVSFLDSAAVHARNLFEFAEKKDGTRFTLHGLGGTGSKSDAWDHWANNRVAHMTQRDESKAPWPEGRDAWNRPDKLLRMAAAVLERLRDGGSTIALGELRDTYDEVLAAAAAYLADPSPETHENLAVLFDDGSDEPYPE